MHGDGHLLSVSTREIYGKVVCKEHTIGKGEPGCEVGTYFLGARPSRSVVVSAMQLYSSLVVTIDKPLVQSLYVSIAEIATVRGAPDALYHLRTLVRCSALSCSAVVHWRHVVRVRRTLFRYARAVGLSQPMHVRTGLALEFSRTTCLGCLGPALADLRRRILAAGEAIVTGQGVFTMRMHPMLFSLYWSIDMSASDIEALHAAQALLPVRRFGGQLCSTFSESAQTDCRVPLWI